LTDEDVIYCHEKRDALVLLDHVIPNVSPAPIDSNVLETQHVHLCGFAKLEQDREHFFVAGQVKSVGLSDFNITCQSIPGLSGGAVVCDGSGGVIGYCGGARGGSDASPFGVYAFRADFILVALLERKEAEKAEEVMGEF
jgi:hypothetical protein